MRGGWDTAGMMAMSTCKSLARFMLILALLLPCLGQAGHGDPLPKTDLVTHETGQQRGVHRGIAVTGGCVGGAVLGTVVPIFGNLVGCAAGGLAGWWFSRRQGPDGTAPQVQAAH